MNKEFWEQRYETGQTGWDTGQITTPIKTYADTAIPNKSAKILIPGAGNSHEAEYLWTQGYSHVYVLDIAAAPLENFAKRVPDFPKEHLLLADFFKFDATFDLIIEQTFFCALNPNLRPLYAQKMHTLLRPRGILAGLLFNFPLTADGPPFGGDAQEYKTLFEPYFVLKTLEPSYNSIKPRQGRELFFIFEKSKQLI